MKQTLLFIKKQEMAMMDPQVEELAAHYEANGQPLLAMQIRSSNSIKDVDLNPRMLGTNQSYVSYWRHNCPGISRSGKST